jgi:TP901 family phage tail tape measure protein
MALNSSLGMGFVFTARDLASGTMARVERQFRSLDDAVTGGEERMRSAFGELGVGIGLVTAGAATLAASFALASAAGRFESAIAAVGAISGATTTELGALRDAAIQAGIATQFSPVEATLGLRELAQAGFTARESIALLMPVLDLAGGSLGELSPQAAAGLAAQAMKAFGLSAESAGLAVDQMLQAVNVFALNASELPLALGTASRGAQTLGQSLSETLIALGLVKNIIPGVERASTAVAVAMERMADPAAQKRLRGLGVEVVNAQGQFRSFLDVLGDLAPRLAGMTEAQRSAFLLKAFGREALGGVNAILTQINNGIPSSTGAILRGAEAVSYLRTQFEQAGGTAATFREKMLDTFEGQKKLLAGSLETLAITLGEPFAALFKPLVAGVTGAVNILLEVFRSMPAPLKKAFAGATLFLGTLLSVVGGVIAAKASIALAVIGMKALGLTLAGVAATALPVVAAVGLLTAVGASLYFAYQKNLGGFRDLVDRVVQRVSLAFRGLAQLFQDGVLSGAVMDELGRAESDGVLAFVTRMWQLVHRAGAVWEGFKAGVQDALTFAAPVFAALSESLAKLGFSFGAAGGSIGAAVANLPSEGFRTFGLIVGRVVGGIAAVLTALVTVVVNTFAETARIFNLAWSVVSSIVSAVGGAMGWLSDKLGTAVDAVGEALRYVPPWLRPAYDAAVAPSPVGARAAAVAEPMSVMPAATDLEVRAGALDRLEGALMSRPDSGGRRDDIHVTATLVADGETLARVTRQGARSDAARAFTPLQSF